MFSGADLRGVTRKCQKPAELVGSVMVSGGSCALSFALSRPVADRWHFGAGGKSARKK